MAANQEKVWIGFDLGGTKMLTVAYDQDWAELGRRRRKTRGRDGSDSGVERIGSTIDRLLDESNIGRDAMAGIGIGCPGPIDLEPGQMAEAQRHVDEQENENGYVHENLCWRRCQIGRPEFLHGTLHEWRLIKHQIVGNSHGSTRKYTEKEQIFCVVPWPSGCGLY